MQVSLACPARGWAGRLKQGPRGGNHRPGILRREGGGVEAAGEKRPPPGTARGDRVQLARRPFKRSAATALSSSGNAAGTGTAVKLAAENDANELKLALAS